MPFGREAKPCRVYEYGCLPPVAGEEAFEAQIRRKNDLWNNLVEIERDYRARVREVLALPDDPIPALLERRDALQEQIKAKRKAARSGRVEVAELRRQVRELNVAILDAVILRREARKTAVEANRTRLDQLEIERRQAVKAAVKSSGLYWVNYDEVRAAYETARKRAMREGTELRFHRFNGAGKVSIRYQYGLPAANAFGTDTRLQIDPVDPVAAWDHPVRAVRRKAARTKVRLRVCSESHRPVWIELPMVMHRPLPADGEIRAASVVRERVGRKYRYKLVVTVALSDGVQQVAPPKDGAVAIDLGWRMVEGGLRVAYWADDQGRHGQLVLPDAVLHEFEKCRDLRAIRDKRFNDIKAVLSAWAAEHTLPDWLAEELKTLSAWRSPARLIMLLHRWAESRFAEDGGIWDHLQEWMRKEVHLYDWETNLRDQVGRRRREIYRIFAANLARRYRTVVLERFDLRQVAEKPAPEDGTKGTLPADRQRVIASVSTLRGAIENAVGRIGGTVVRMDARLTTMECAECGHTEKFDAARQLWRTCPACSASWDQDHNAARVLLARFFANQAEIAAEN